MTRNIYDLIEYDEDGSILRDEYPSSGKVSVDTDWNGSFHDAYEITHITSPPVEGEHIIEYSSYDDLLSKLHQINNTNLVDACKRFDLSRKA